MNAWTRCLVTAAAVAAFQPALAQAPAQDPISPVPGGGELSNFTCNSKTGLCQCKGEAECLDLGNSRLCVDGTVRQGESVGSLKCEFKFRRPVRGPVRE
ncbi:hypothetical protein [Caldimonas brevitalea]|uniref:Uncharacterized protein n=1 Tax=Caldimonas brevitalea TaxID=413882 RepID=A0A0G3BNU1_9BURK|nr:hypothetical protein [Caldimonas brevitalea]AKJ29658.1 hypothetical protein AAW51_2967 [Caldimonas brevitalea]